MLQQLGHKEKKISLIFFIFSDLSDGNLVSASEVISRDTLEKWPPGSLLLTWFNLNPIMDK